MPVKYNRLSFQKRVAIYYLNQQGCSQRDIARQLDVSPSTICRELQRNKTGKYYFPEIAQHKAQAKRCRRDLILTSSISAQRESCGNKNDNRTANEGFS